ncbi:MAG: Holliday junction branch migration protein RuvA [Clostridiales bacterium]|nr:Holliday junction branch migration protein RuvA [Clostridiales bacterium]
MYYYISGKLTKTGSNYAVIDNHGIGYLLSVSVNTLRHIDGTAEVKLFTYLSVREDAQELFGFYSEEELFAFKQLISVSGIGPKAALAILSVLTPAELASAIGAGDTKAICAAQGVGKRTAERVVLELKDKLAIGTTANSSGTSESMVVSSASNVSEAVNALIVLGYTRQEAMKAVSGIDAAGMEIDDIIKAALKKML